MVAYNENDELAVVQQNIENNIYEILKGGKLGETIIKKCPHQSVEELAEIMTQGYKASVIGDVVKRLALRPKSSGFQAICDVAFKNAMLKVLTEAKVESEAE